MLMTNLKDLVVKYGMEIKGVIHIGAHYGIFEEVIFKEFTTNQAFFEPIDSSFAVIKNNFEGKYPIFNIALGNTTGKMSMYVDHCNSGMSSSILEPKEHLKYYPEIDFPEIKEVDIIKLKDAELDFSNYNFINIDVQGYELEVFRGAGKLLNEIDYIYTEVSTECLYANQPLVRDIDNYLVKFGFERVETVWTANAFGDALYIKVK